MRNEMSVHCLLRAVFEDCYPELSLLWSDGVNWHVIVGIDANPAGHCLAN